MVVLPSPSLDQYFGFQQDVKDLQALPGILIQDCQDTKLPAIMGMMQQKVIGPHMIRILRSETNTRTIIQP